MAKPALGKGLGALIKKNQALPGQAPDGSTDDSPRVRDIPIDKVVPSPLQPRNQFIDTPIDELVDSIRQHGIIQPLIARLVDGKYELIAGERRWRASKKLGLATVPVIERAASDRDVLEMALIENLQREDLNPIEEAAGYVRLAKEFTLKQEEIATRVGKSRASVANAMRLLDLHEDIQLHLAQRQITVGHAKAILALKDADSQKLAADQIIRRKLTVRAAEKLTQSLLANPSGAPDPKKAAPKEVDIHIRDLTKRLQEHLATHVAINHTAKKGKIEIEYYGNDDLERLLELLKLPNPTL
ncbi:MAG: ParB/RepB/Spo0J family partition protein [Akkermansiaceae bacterium]|jgi:ParB family transcriptional regulator, chromosome partitioning protein|nr:ParB/RepB/Spo0J family partition protein [Akkermansiaceae bacterium]MDP4646557.1 ParB/RepB/Spo0J family partition protein [Akkermansiaceae bacterium]MDP4781111.1 ParB/RepB/Spo0J family partition protein [Akkermansiaceae bacterium]MDP4846446.1 ParB/RepB/Spo0J family partition protein [Akkermansiaceae bacterium]MDP4896747.1 ParB/RepB/Spo0J family partition protein [Akkermansiaceae bacterium]